MCPATFSDEVQAMHAEMARQPPIAAMAAFPREQAALAAAGTPDGIIAAGSPLSDADLLDVDGQRTTLYRAAADRTAVVVFYRGTWCPYCNLALGHYQANLLPALVERGVALIAISPQTPDQSLTMQEKHELAYTVLSDPGNTLAERIGILTAPSEEARAAQLELGLDLTAVNADGTTTIAMPSTLILDRKHVVRWIDVHPDYSARSEVGDILAALDTAGL